MWRSPRRPSGTRADRWTLEPANLTSRRDPADDSGRGVRRYDLRKATACEVVDFARLRFVVRRPKDKRGDLEFLAPSSEILREASARLSKAIEARAFADVWQECNRGAGPEDEHQEDDATCTATTGRRARFYHQP